MKVFKPVYAEAKIVSTIRHPEYRTMTNKWFKWRLTYEGGDDFIDQYLKYYSTRETYNDFSVRKSITYLPAFAKAAIEDIRKAIYSRANNIRRLEGSDNYKKAIAGYLGGVDYTGSSMNGFIGESVLTELLPMAKVGIYVDMHNDLGATMASTKDKHPYVYVYKAEDILSWCYDNDNELEAVLLRRHTYEVDKVTGLPTESEICYRYIRKTDTGILIEDYDEEAMVPFASWNLDLKVIPFIILETNVSLMAEIANYQIALLNMASSDINYVTKSNFPFYTEQYDPKSELADYIRSAKMASTAEMSNVTATSVVPTEGTASDAAQAKPKEVVIGASQGRKYGMGLERPGFIHPSPEPLRASMEKQSAMKGDIRELVSLSLSNMRVRMASAESKEADQEGLVTGLACIGVILEKAERKISEFWHMYENKTNTVVVSYPREYALISETERSKQAMEKGKVMILVPSKTFQKEMAKDIAQSSMGHKTDPTTMDTILTEIDEAQVMNTDPESIRKDAEAGLVSNETASVTIGYPEGEAEKAAIDHAERLARIQEAQKPKDGTPTEGGQKAVLQMEDKSMAKDMKENSQEGDYNEKSNKNKTRGSK